MTWRATFAAILLTGCGANEALPTPDLPSRDASADAAVIRDAGPSTPSLRERCVDLDRSGHEVSIDVGFVVGLGRTDVALLIDTTSSMGAVFDSIRSTFRSTLVPEISRTIPDVRFAIAGFGDFPIAPFGDTARSYVVRVGTSSTPNPRLAQAALDAMSSAGGGDTPESGLEALFHLATGEGLGPFVDPASACPDLGQGGACFRRDATPIFVVVTDSPQHNGTNPSFDYPLANFPSQRPHTFDETISALRSVGARVIGIDAGDGSARSDLAELASRARPSNGAGSGVVLSLDRDPTAITPKVLDAIRDLAGSIVQSVDLVLVDPIADDELDPTSFVTRVEALEVVPAGSAERIEASHFVRVRAGSTVRFRVHLTLPSGYVSPALLSLDAILRGDERGQIENRGLFVAIPREDGSGGCDAAFP